MTNPDYPSDGQGVLPTLEAPESLRHPMWTKPTRDLPQHTYALRLEIWARLQPFDGHPNMARLVEFVEEVYVSTGRVTWYTSADVTIAGVVRLAYQHQDKNWKLLNDNINRLSRQFTDAILKESTHE